MQTVYLTLVLTWLSWIAKAILLFIALALEAAYRWLINYYTKQQTLLYELNSMARMFCISLPELKLQRRYFNYYYITINSHPNFYQIEILNKYCFKNWSDIIFRMFATLRVFSKSCLQEYFLFEIEFTKPQGLDINTLNDRNETPLHIASFKGSWPAIRTLVSYGASINARS